jgi:hypothetical protein
MGGQLTPPVTPAKKTKATPKVSAKGKKVAKADKAETHSKTGTTPPSSVDGLPEAYDFDDNIFGKDETYVKFEWDKDVI